MLPTRPRIDERAIVAGTHARFALLLLLVSSGALMEVAFGSLFRTEPYGSDVCALAAGQTPGITPGTFKALWGQGVAPRQTTLPANSVMCRSRRCGR